MIAFETSTLAKHKIFNKKENRHITYELRFSALNDFAKYLHLDYVKNGEIIGVVMLVHGKYIYSPAKENTYSQNMPMIIYDLLKQLSR